MKCEFDVMYIVYNKDGEYVDSVFDEEEANQTALDLNGRVCENVVVPTENWKEMEEELYGLINYKNHIEQTIGDCGYEFLYDKDGMIRKIVPKPIRYKGNLQ